MHSICVIHTDKCISHHSSRTLLFAMETTTENQNQWINSPKSVDKSVKQFPLKAQGRLWKREDCDRKDVRAKLSLTNVKNYTCNVSPTWLPKCELNKDINKHAKVDDRKIMRPQIEVKNYRQLRNAKNRSKSSLGKNTPTGYPTQSNKPWKHTYSIQPSRLY